MDVIDQQGVRNMVEDRGRRQATMGHFGVPLSYLAELGLVPGAIITVFARAPFDGPITLGVGNAIHHLDMRMAQAILVQEVAIEEATT